LDRDVVLPAFVENPYFYMRRAAVFVLSSQWEGLANVLIEALACGRPVVSTDCPNLGSIYPFYDVSAPEELSLDIEQIIHQCLKRGGT